MKEPEFESDTLPVGVVGRPRGLSGELTLHPYNPGGFGLRGVTSVVLVHGKTRTTFAVQALRRAGQGWVLRLLGIATRDDAEKLVHASVRIDRRLLPPLGESEFFVEDLLGCTVQNEQGEDFGRVESLFWNGAQDVMSIQGTQETLIPVVPEFVRTVDVLGRRVVVDWVWEPVEVETSEGEGEEGGRESEERAGEKHAGDEREDDEDADAHGSESASDEKGAERA